MKAIPAGLIVLPLSLPVTALGQPADWQQVVWREPQVRYLLAEMNLGGDVAPAASIISRKLVRSCSPKCGNCFANRDSRGERRFRGRAASSQPIHGTASAPRGPRNE